MPMLPRLARPCPYLDRLDEMTAGGFCRACRQEVHDLTGLGEAARAEFLAACSGSACISLTAWVPPAVAAAAIAASAAVLATPAAAARAHPVASAVHPAHPPHKVPRVRAVPLVPITTGGLPAPLPPPPAPPVDDGAHG